MTLDIFIKKFNLDNCTKKDLDEFVSSWSGKEIFEEISKEEFMTYFKDLSVSVCDFTRFNTILQTIFN